MMLHVLLAVAAIQSCQPVDGDQILMRDLAAADARFAAADPARPAGYSPQPGATRVFWPIELMQLARQTGVVTEAPFIQICFQRRSHVLTNDEITTAIRQWAPPKATIEVLDSGRLPIPPGKIVIPEPAAVQTAQDGSVLLRGMVEFSATQRYPIWARVRLKLTQRVLVATGDIAIGTAIGPDLMRFEDRDSGIEAIRFANDPEQISGRVATRRIAAGAPIPVAALEPPKQVLQGAIVKVEVQNGLARLVLDGEAQASGRTGDVIRVRNPSSGKSFQARIVGMNAVQVIPRGLALVGTEQK